MRTLGIDLGTSGVRAVVLGADGLEASQSTPLAARRDSAALWTAVATVLARLPLGGVGAAAVAGTSGTLLAIGADGTALGALSLYNDPAEPAAVAAMARVAPASSPVHGHASALGRALTLARLPGAHRIVHEADWIAGSLCGEFGSSDENNALKTGYDPVARAWPAWIAELGLRPALLPQVVPPGVPIARVSPDIAARFGLPRNAVVAAGTTDGCASFLSTGANSPGDAVTVLGSTITLKLLSQAPVSAPSLGIYSHRVWDDWLVGGASNSGGAVLAAYFSVAELETLSARIDSGRPSGLSYYPLLRPGERFPVNDPGLLPILSPRPTDNALFLQGMLEGMAAIEASGYRRLAELGAPGITGVATVGGGAGNPAWTAIRSQRLGVPVTRADGASAAHGAALVARRALPRAPQFTAATSSRLA